LRRTILVASLVFLLAAAAFGGTMFRSDPGHSSATFTVRHMLVTNVPGRFKEMTVMVDYDEADVTKSSVKAVIKTGSIDTDHARRDDDLRSANFFDAANHPEITFESKRIEKRGDNFVAIGPLTMRGVSKEIELPFEILGKIKDQRGRARMGVHAAITIDRFEWGIAWNRLLEGGGAVVGREVKIELNLELIEVPAEPPAPPTPAAPPTQAG
jgi:polyisoprenoid-binding protein YceI